MPDLFQIGGQSNARGRAGFSTFAMLKATVGAFTAWPYFAVEWERLTGRKVDVVNARVGSSAQVAAADVGAGSWCREGTLWDASVALLDPKLEGRMLRGVLWVQGERDSTAIDADLIVRADYEAGLVDMIARYRERYGAELPFYIVRTGRPADGDTPGFADVRAAQVQVAEDDPLTHVVYLGTVDFPDLGWMHDDVHWATVGLEQVGTLSAQYIVGLGG